MSKLITVRKGYNKLRGTPNKLLNTSARINNMLFVPENLFAKGSSLVTPSNNSSMLSSNSFNWGNANQRQMAVDYSGAMTNIWGQQSKDYVNNFGKGPLVENKGGDGGSGVDAGQVMGMINGKGGSGSGSGNFWQSILKGVASVADTPFTVDGYQYKRGIYDATDPFYKAGNTKFSDGSKGHIENKMGNTFSDLGVQTFKAGVNNWDPYTMLAGAAFKSIGDVINNGWGMAYNDKAIKAAEGNTNQARKFGSVVGQAGTNDDLLNASGFMATGTGITDPKAYVKGGVFKKGKAKKEGQKIINNEESALAYQGNAFGDSADNVDYMNDSDVRRLFVLAYGGPMDGIDPSTAIGYSLYTDKYIKDNNKNSANMSNMFAGMPGSMFAFGGGTYTNGASFSDGLTHINAGDSHEENPNDGVLVGVDNEGTPNLVEEGEVIYNDYVFSNRLTIPDYKKQYKSKKEAPYEALVLWNYSGKTFAEAAKKIEKNTGASERSTDVIAQRGMESDLQVLAQVLEKEREKQRLKELQEAIDRMTPEEFAALLQQMLQLQEMQAAQELQAQQEEEIAQLEAIQLLEAMQLLELPSLEEMAMALQQMMQLAAEQAAVLQLAMAAYGGPIYALGGALDNQDSTNDANLYAKGGYKGTFADFKKELSDKGVSLSDYLQFLVNDGKLTLEDIDIYGGSEALLENAFNKDFAQSYLDNLDGNSFDSNDPMANVFKHYNATHDEKLTVEDWNKLSKRQKSRYIKLYRSTLKKLEKTNFDNQVTAYNLHIELKDKVDKYRKAQRNSTLTDTDIKNLSYSDKVRLAKYMNPQYKSQEFDKLSLNEKDEANKKINLDLISMSKDTNTSIGALSEAFNNPLYHRNWKPVDADKAWVNNGYDWDNPIYGETSPVPVIGGNTDGHWEARDWTIKDDGEHKGWIKVGDNYYKDMKEYELSDAYLNPRYELAKSAAASDEEGRKLWEDYVKNRLSPDYATSYDPTLIFGEKFADNVGSELLFKDYIRNNYDALNTTDKDGHRSGFFDLIAGLMHGTYNPIRNRELYLIRGNEGQYLTPEGNWLEWYTDTVEDDGEGTKIHTLTPKAGYTFSRMDALPEGVRVNDNGIYTTEAETDNDKFPRAPAWPYLAGLGLQLGALGYNIFSPKDYSNANAIISAALLAGKYNPVEFRPIGDYLTYRPMDIWFELNRLNANARATDRMLANTNNSNRNAALLANAYTDLIASGNLYRSALEYNDALRKQVGEFNKDTNKFNSEGFLKADMANLTADSRAKAYLFEGLKSGYAMKQAVDDARASAINAGISGVANNLFSYALNKYNLDVLGWGMRHGAYAPMAVGAEGGKIRRKRKGLNV